MKIQNRRVFAEGSGEEVSKVLKGIGINLVIANAERTRRFLKEILGLEILRFEGGYIIARHNDMVIQFHEDKTFIDNPIYHLLPENPPRGIGVEIRLYQLDPNNCEQLAKEKGYEVLMETAHHAHGLIECTILDDDGYCWVPSIIPVH